VQLGAGGRHYEHVLPAGRTGAVVPDEWWGVVVTVRVASDESSGPSATRPSFTPHILTVGVAIGIRGLGYVVLTMTNVAWRTKMRV
jgi:hypothetical protein